MNRRELISVLGAVPLWGQPGQPVLFVCPMDREVRSSKPDRCPKCGMRLLAGIPDPEEYPVRLRMTPRNARPGSRVNLEISVQHPKTALRVSRFEAIHEKLLHIFIVSEDLEFFLHEHPTPQPGGTFWHDTILPKSGEYRVLLDFYPAGATPQMIAKTIVLPGERRRPELRPDLSLKDGINLKAALRVEPTQAIAGTKAMLFCDLDTDAGLEPYLGAWGHMLAASADLVDMIHSHPAWEEAGKTIQFNVIFPRPGMHRVWLQFQRKGVVNTFAFNVPVTQL